MADETTSVITPVVETESHLTEPLISHEGKIAHLEEAQSRYAEDLTRQIAELETRLQAAISANNREQATRVESRITELESKLSKVEDVPAEAASDLPSGGVEINTPPEVEPSPQPPEKVRKGLRHRRRARRKGK